MKDRVVIVGAGIAGLAAALALAGRGFSVSVVERGPAPGGKLREIGIGGARIDSGPTVFTMRWVFEELFAAVGRNFSDAVALQPLNVLARHAWDDKCRLDLFADEARSVEAIGDFAGAAEAKRYRKFCADSREIYRILEQPFLRASAPSLGGLMAGKGIRGMMELTKIRPFTTMWNALGDYFHDLRLRQLFGRYATYCGSSPYLAPATLMLVAHVEREGVWSIDGGMHSLATALVDAATALGATFHYDSDVAEVLTAQGRACGVALRNGERIAADHVIVNADVSAVATGLFGDSVGRAATAIAPSARSLSAITWSMVAKADGFPLSRHSVFLSRDYAAEFDSILNRGEVPDEPTVYVCAQDRFDGPALTDTTHASEAERLLVLINAPANGDRKSFDDAEIARCAARAHAVLARCGLRIDGTPEATVVTTPADFNKLFPATGGALYGRGSHGWTASFQRPGARTKIPGLYLAGGSTHPGPGVPMAALSGRAAAASLIEDVVATQRSWQPVPALTSGAGE